VEFFHGQSVRDRSGRPGTVVEVSYLSVRVYFPGQGVVDFLRPKGTEVAPQGAATVADIVPRDSMSDMSKMISNIMLRSKAFAIDEHHLVVANAEVKRYPIEGGKNRFESILAALRLATSDL